MKTGIKRFDIYQAQNLRQKILCKIHNSPNKKTEKGRGIHEVKSAPQKLGQMCFTNHANIVSNKSMFNQTN